MTSGNLWQDAIIDELVCCHIYQAEHDTSPRKGLHDAISWHVQVALDPQVSSDAQALIDKGAANQKAKMLKELQCHTPLRKMWTLSEVIDLLEKQT
jgi:hypothetical protein